MGSHASKSLSTAQRDAAWREMYQDYKCKLDAPDMTAEEVMKAPEAPILVDVRGFFERRVSMLPGAISQEEFEARLKSGVQSDRLICYCTIGYRSGRYSHEVRPSAAPGRRRRCRADQRAVSQLRKQGLDAYNLAGGIIAWTHAGGCGGGVAGVAVAAPHERLRSLVLPATGEPTKGIHVFARKWDLAPVHMQSTWFV